MSDYKDRLFLQQKGDDLARYLGMPIKVFRRNIEELGHAELIALKDYIDTRDRRSSDFKRKSQCIQNRLSQLKNKSAPLPTYFMQNAERLLPADVFQKIKDAAIIDRDNARKAA